MINSDTSLAIISASTAHGGADLRLTALIGEQARKDFLSNRLFSGIQRAVNASLRDPSQTVAECVLIAWWA